MPFHNEEESLRELVPSLMKNVQYLDRPLEVILVDDVSNDNGAEVARKFQEQYQEIKLIRLSRRGGQSGCFERAFQSARGEYIIRMDADLQDDPRDLPKLVEKIDEGSELVVGLRECRKHSRMLRLASGIYDLIILALFDSPLHSNSGSYVAFKADLVKNIPFGRSDHRYLPIIAMHRGAQNIAEVIVRHSQRRWGRSKYNPFKKLLLGFPQTVAFLIRLKSGVYDLN